MVHFSVVADPEYQHGELAVMVRMVANIASIKYVWKFAPSCLRLFSMLPIAHILCIAEVVYIATFCCLFQALSFIVKYM